VNAGLCTFALTDRSDRPGRGMPGPVQSNSVDSVRSAVVSSGTLDGPFSGVCVVCSRKPGATDRSPRQNGPTTQLPPFAESAINRLARCHKLTRRETQVLTLVCAGLKNSLIARILCISLPTVRLHMRNLHSKTNTADKVELILNLWHSCAGAAGPPAGRKCENLA